MKIYCEHCDGEGRESDEHERWVDCTVCNGAGYIEEGKETYYIVRGGDLKETSFAEFIKEIRHTGYAEVFTTEFKDKIEVYLKI